MLIFLNKIIIMILLLYILLVESLLRKVNGLINLIVKINKKFILGGLVLLIRIIYSNIILIKNNIYI